MISLPPPDPELTAIARKNQIYKITPDLAGDRLDKFVAEAVGLSRGKVRALIEFGSVWVRGKVCRRQSRVLEPGDWVVLQAPAYGPVRFYEADPERILYRDNWLLAYHKEPGIPCQQTPYDGYNHLFGALKRCLEKTGAKNSYLALHHRLDSPTSGAMVFSVNQQVNSKIGRIFREGPLTKLYLAAVGGQPQEDEWEIDRPVGSRKGGYYCPEDGTGKPARTLFRVLARGASSVLLQAHPFTGRTHQIRLHLAASGLPILGDFMYGGRPHERLMLHAASIEFHHPVTGNPLKIEASPPRGFRPEDFTA